MAVMAVVVLVAVVAGVVVAVVLVVVGVLVAVVLEVVFGIVAHLAVSVCCGCLMWVVVVGGVVGMFVGVPACVAVRVMSCHMVVKARGGEQRASSQHCIVYGHSPLAQHWAHKKRMLVSVSAAVRKCVHQFPFVVYLRISIVL